jgi:hypothetical protein
MEFVVGIMFHPGEDAVTGCDTAGTSREREDAAVFPLFPLLPLLFSPLLAEVLVKVLVEEGEDLTP